ncbi:DUF5985 family protein [Caulobacter sp. 17J80-11]|uniref:DUF5985 family protein n=1 Tax=Caulobacter sp. 17J80-11 TaxID=2763502 RepID=UPI00351C6E72
MTDVGPAIVYLLCLATSMVCAALLVRSYLRTRTRLLLWSALCFVLLALNNLFVVGDMILLPSVDLTLGRQLSALAAVCVLLYGFIWETE